MDSIYEIGFWVQDVAESKIKRFYPSTLQKISTLPLDIIFNELLKMSEDGKLNLLWEIECPECYSTCDTITSDDIRRFTLNESEWQCRYGHEFIITLDNVFPAFEINADYKKEVRAYKYREEDKKKRSLLWRSEFR